MGCLGFGVVEASDEFEAAEAGQSQVRDNDIVKLAFRQHESFIAATANRDVIALGAEHLLQRRGNAGVILD